MDRRLVAIALFGVIACTTDLPTEGPERVGPTLPFAAEIVSAWQAVDGTGDLPLAESLTIAVPTPNSIDSALLALLAGQPGPVVVELTGALTFAGQPIPLGEVLNDDGAAYWHWWNVHYAGALDPDSPPEPPPGATIAEGAGEAEWLRYRLVHAAAGVADSQDFPLVSRTTNTVRVRLEHPSAGTLRLQVDHRGWNSYGYFLAGSDILYYWYWDWAVEDWNQVGCFATFEPATMEMTSCLPFPPEERRLIGAEQGIGLGGTITVKVYRGAGVPQIPRLVLQRDTVPPVLWQVFNARAGSAKRSTDDAAVEQLRSDTLSVRIQVDTASGRVPRDTFWLETTTRPGSGYHTHDHATRPRGRLWQASGAAGAARGPGGDSLLRVILPDSGKLRVIFRSSGVSGIEVIRLHRGSPTGPVADSAVVTVKVRGLVRMPRDVAGLYYFKDQDSTVAGQGHGNFNDGVTPAFRDSVERAFRKYLARGLGFLRGETRFVITEASLPWGGLLDIAERPAAAWSYPHRTHRTGTDMDIRTHSPGDEPPGLRAIMDDRRQDAFLKACDSVINCNYETPFDPVPRPYHFHLKPRTVGQ